MDYFGGGGVRGALHPSLRVYIDCFHSSPLPRIYPRGGGAWDQDPCLMRDFREIRKIELHFKEVDAQKSELSGGGGYEEGGLPNPENLIDQYLEEQGMEDDAYF